MRDDKIEVGLLTVLLCSVLTSATAVPSIVGYVFVVVVYGIVLSVCYLRGMLAVRYDRVLLYPIVALWIIFLISLIRYPTSATLLRTAAFIVFTGINLFVLPATFSKRQFIDALSLIASVVTGITVPIAIPALLAGTEGIGVWDVNQGTPVLASIFTNPNQLATLSVFGVVALFGFARTKRRQRWAISGVLFCLVGLAVSQGRAALLALVGAFILILSYWFDGTRATTGVVALGIIGGIAIVALAVGLVPDSFLPSGFFTNRSGLWAATLRAIDARPALGWGLVEGAPVIEQFGAPTPGGHTPGVHNSYLRMFLNVGVLGGELYLIVCAVVLIRAIQSLQHNISSNVDYIILPLLAVALTLQLFEPSTIFGLSMASTIEAMIFGFAQRPERTIPISSVMVDLAAKTGLRSHRSKLSR